MTRTRPGQTNGAQGEGVRMTSPNGSSPDRATARQVRDLEPDTLDRQIISMLQADGRCSNREIARQLDVPEATIRYRVRRLTESGLLRITALVAPEHLGYQLTVVISAQVEGKQVDAVADSISKLPEVMWLAVTSGTTDIVFTASFQGHDHLYEFLTERLAPLQGVVRTDTSIGLRVVKRDTEWAFDLTSEVSDTSKHVRA